MAAPLVLRRPQCISCARHFTGGFESAFQLPAHQQIRGIKKLVKVSTTKVQLLRNIPKYGAKGAVVSVPSGTMRNSWYPKKMAEYMTSAKMNEMGIKKEAVGERDSTFASGKQRKNFKKQQAEELLKQEVEKASERRIPDSISLKDEAAPAIELKLLSPEESTAILENLLPPNLEFYRTPVVVAAPKVQERISPSVPTTSSVSAAAKRGKEEKKAAGSSKTSIYGSVSINDIAANLKAILAEDKKGAHVVFASEDISFVEQTEEKDRVKHLGVFKIEIRLKGAPDVVKRTIQVQAQE